MHDDLSALAGFLPASTLAAWRALAPVVPRVAYLSGGTALAAHVQHRVSRDLDFFAEAAFEVRALQEALDEHIPTEEGPRLLVAKYRPVAPTGLIANVVRGLGCFDDVENDPSLPVPRSSIEAFWARGQAEIVDTLAL